MTLEGIVEQGRIRLTDDVLLPDKTKVYVLVPDFRIEQVAQIVSPRLARREDAAAFRMEVLPEEPDDNV